MSEFGDAEPEDAWQADDPLPVLLDNLRRRAALLAALVAAGTEREPVLVRMFLLADHLADVLRRFEAEHG